MKAIFLKIEINDSYAIYSSSDFLMDTLPAFLLKLRNRKAKWIVCVFLIVPSLFRDYSKGYSRNNDFSLPSFTRVIYFFSQRITLFLTSRWAYKILVLNKIDKEYLVKNRAIAESRITVVSGGVDYNRLKSLGDLNTETYDAVFLGRMHPQKGIFDLIKIWKLVCNQKPKAQLLIIAGGLASFAEKVNALIAENNLRDNINLAGFRQGDKKFELLKSSKIFLCPSYYESFAIVIAEAMACGLPVVAYNLDIYQDIYGDYINKVPLGDIQKFADAIVYFLNHEIVMRRFGLEGQKFIEKYDWAEIARKEFQLIVG